MPAFENGLFGFVAPQDLLDVGFSVTRPNDPIDTLFGDVRTDNIMAMWQTIAADYQVPMMAQFHGFDTESHVTFRAPIDNHRVEKGLIKVKINQSERLRELTRSGVQQDQLYDFVLNDSINLADQVITRSKVAKNEVMATGKFTIKENNLNLDIDYGVPDANVSHTIDFGADDIPGQIEAVIGAARNNGVMITGMMTSSRVLNKIRANEAVQKAVNGNMGIGALVRRSALEAYLSEEFGINQVIVNDLTYGAEGKIGKDGKPVITSKRYYPDNKITFFAVNPGGKLGTGLWGDPPELDIADHAKVEQSGESPFVYVTQWAEKDPAVLWTKASGLFIPVLHNPGSLYIATVQG